MRILNTPACVIRRKAYGDYDLILTLFTQKCGKLSAIAKYAKKSKRRFAGVLEPFTLIETILKYGRGNLPVLQEASLNDPFTGIRADMEKTAYASYWSEILGCWLEEGREQQRLFNLLVFAMKQLGMGRISGKTLSILFQIRFLMDTGLSPVLETCRQCRTPIDKISNDLFFGDLPGGGILCHRCGAKGSGKLTLSRGTVKKLIWMKDKPIEAAARIRFSSPAEAECLEFLNAFLGYHLGKKCRSLDFLKTLEPKRRGSIDRCCKMNMEVAN